MNLFLVAAILAVHVANCAIDADAVASDNGQGRMNRATDLKIEKIDICCEVLTKMTSDLNKIMSSVVLVSKIVLTHICYSLC